MADPGIRILFLISALFDFIVGGAFLFMGPQLFSNYNVPLPPHWGYIHFCCLLLMIFGLMFLMVAIAPRANRNLIPYGVLLKASYVGVAGYYWINGGVPWVYQPFVFTDAIMLVGFVWAYLRFDPKMANSLVTCHTFTPHWPLTANQADRPPCPKWIPV